MVKWNAMQRRNQLLFYHFGKLVPLLYIVIAKVVEDPVYIASTTVISLLFGFEEQDYQKKVKDFEKIRGKSKTRLKSLSVS